MSSVKKTMRSPESAAQHYSVKINSYSQEVSQGLFMFQEMFLGVCDTKTKIPAFILDRERGSRIWKSTINNSHNEVNYRVQII